MIKVKSTGIVRKIDGLGRIVIPKELRKRMGLDEGTAMEIFVEEGRIIFEKYEPGCIFCGEMEDTFEFEGEKVCRNCCNKILGQDK